MAVQQRAEHRGAHRADRRPGRGRRAVSPPGAPPRNPHDPLGSTRLRRAPGPRLPRSRASRPTAGIARRARPARPPQMSLAAVIDVDEGEVGPDEHDGPRASHLQQQLAPSRSSCPVPARTRGSRSRPRYRAVPRVRTPRARPGTSTARSGRGTTHGAGDVLPTDRAGHLADRRGGRRVHDAAARRPSTAARTTAPAPSTLARYIAVGSRGHIWFTPADVEDDLAAPHAIVRVRRRHRGRRGPVRRSESRDRPRRQRRIARVARTSKPCSTSRRTNAPPTKPLPPVTKTGPSHRVRRDSRPPNLPR